MSQDTNHKGGKRLQKASEKPASHAPKAAKKETSAKAAVAEKPFYKRPIFIIPAIITVLAAGLFTFWNVFSAPPEVKIPERPSRAPSYTTTVDPDTGEEIQVQVETSNSDLKPEFYTFLLFGQDTSSGLTDTMMLCSYDVPNQKLSIMSLPRDTLVRYNGREIMLNSVYNRSGGKKDHEAAATALKNEVGELTGVYPNFDVLIQWDAFGELVDAIDGVDFDVPRNMKYNDPTQNLHINQAAGYRHLTGDDAMQVIRWRHNNDGTGYINGDLGRVETQQALMKAIIEKCLDPTVLLSNLPEYISIFQKNVDTNLSVSDMTYFAKSAISGLNMDNVAFATMPCKASGYRVRPAKEELLELINAYFNPYVEPLRLDELTVADGAASSYVTGGLNRAASGAAVEGGQAATSSSAKPAATATSSFIPHPSTAAKPTAKPASVNTGKSTSAPKSTAEAKPAATQRPAATAKPATPKPAEAETPVRETPSAVTEKPVSVTRPASAVDTVTPSHHTEITDTPMPSMLAEPSHQNAPAPTPVETAEPTRPITSEEPSETPQETPKDSSAPMDSIPSSEKPITTPRVSFMPDPDLPVWSAFPAESALPIIPSTAPAVSHAPITSATATPVVSTAPVPSTAPEPSSAPAPSTASQPSSAPAPSTASEPSTVPVPSTAPEPSTAPVPSTAPEPSTAPVPSTAPEPSTASVPSTVPEPATAPMTSPVEQIPDPVVPLPDSIPASDEPVTPPQE